VCVCAPARACININIYIYIYIYTHTHTHTHTHTPVIWEILSYQYIFGLNFELYCQGIPSSNLGSEPRYFDPIFYRFFFSILYKRMPETTTVLFHNPFDAALINWAIRRHIFGENNTAALSFKWVVNVSACLRKRSYGMWHRIVWQKFTNVLRELNCSHFPVLKGTAVELLRIAVDMSTLNIAEK
jgi:hypothetical protein